MIFVFSPLHYSTVCEPSASLAICGFADQILFCDLRIWDVRILFFCRLKIAASSLFLLTNKDLKSSDLIFYQIKNSAKETYGQLLSSGFKH